MYALSVRVLVMKMVARLGVVATSRVTRISRTTIWRWKRHGIRAVVKRKRRCLKFELVQDHLRAFLLATQCTCARDIRSFLFKVCQVKISANSVYAFIKRLGFSRKRTQLRGQCKGNNLPELIRIFKQKYTAALDKKTVFASIDECSFNEHLHPLYGWSPKGSPLTITTASGSWTQHSLLMATLSTGQVFWKLQKGSITRACFTTFVDSLPLQHHTLLLDNASIHKGLQLQNPVALCYTPPYSPQFNPIELTFSWIKRRFRSLNTGYVRDLPTILDGVIRSCPVADIVSCFDHVHSLVGAE
jgi:hypothetical protein